ncbi:cation:proton antiporter [Sulfurisoma sediminicola]|uniref:Kef-type potassium/proton antiporter (CPA2 family) n=1 Tax=Sulfurisoma sediminicola TaxID=1381557 RepID=A0A497XB60_9PROT|nr:monovalent cation:proton antiporter-2 (CPA2) family protein [Sulfurisoma sediminicola]RLJ63794.1 Kef-type potassium/proton antiporter (CPA2 family) [Sulfurisoma sediminicola]
MHSQLLSLLLLLTAAVGAVAVMRRFKLPSMLGYLAIGMVLGPHGAQMIGESDEVETFAEFGVVFLMFSIGLEFSLQRLKAMHTLVFGYGSAQMLLTAAGAMLVTWYGYGQDWKSGLSVGLAVAMSSTAIVAKMLSERFELHSRSGRLTMGVLLFQDIAVVPCLILLPALAQPEGNLLRQLGLASLQAAALLVVLIWVGQKLMKRLFDAVAHYRSEELFVLATLWIVVGLAYATGQAGLSLALGAFIGGMLISETVYRHQVEADIRPFRDMLLGLFFVTVGMLLDVGFVLEHFWRLLLAVVLLVVGKGVVVLLITLAARSTVDTALRTSAQLAQAGEFGLVLIQLAYAQKLIAADVFQVTLAAMLISMFIAPFLIERVARLGGEMARGDWAHKAKAIYEVATSAFGMEDHVILCGYGRTGEQIGKFLGAEKIPFLALDVDPTAVKRAIPEGGKVVFGGADRIEVLKAAGLMRAQAMVIAYPDTLSAERVLRLVRSHREDMPIIVRAADESDIDKLKRAGATEVIPEVLEGSLMIAAETLTQLGVPVERAIERVRLVREARYASMREFYHGSGEHKP